MLDAINKQVVAAVNSPDFKTPIEKTGVIAGCDIARRRGENLEGDRRPTPEKLYKEIGFEKVD